MYAMILYVVLINMTLSNIDLECNYGFYLKQNISLSLFNYLSVLSNKVKVTCILSSFKRHLIKILRNTN